MPPPDCPNTLSTRWTNRPFHRGVIGVGSQIPWHLILSGSAVLVDTVQLRKILCPSKSHASSRRGHLFQRCANGRIVLKSIVHGIFQSQHLWRRFIGLGDIAAAEKNKNRAQSKRRPCQKPSKDSFSRFSFLSVKGTLSSPVFPRRLLRLWPFTPATRPGVTSLSLGLGERLSPGRGGSVNSTASPAQANFLGTQ